MRKDLLNGLFVCFRLLGGERPEELHCSASHIDTVRVLPALVRHLQRAVCVCERACVYVSVRACVCVCVFREGSLATLGYSGVLQPVRCGVSVCVCVCV